jgi:hypothetical protein
MASDFLRLIEAAFTQARIGERRCKGAAVRRLNWLQLEGCSGKPADPAGNAALL